MTQATDATIGHLSDLIPDRERSVRRANRQSLDPPFFRSHSFPAGAVRAGLARAGVSRSTVPATGEGTTPCKSDW